MFGYVVLLFFLLICAFLSKKHFRYSKCIAILFSSFFLLFIGLRFDVGTDYLSYKEIFEEHYDVAEVGYNFLSSLVYRFNGEYWELTIITACIIVLCLHHVFKHYGNFYFSYFLYIIMAGGYAFMVNGIRQAMASCFTLLALSYLNCKKKVFLFWCVACCFHLSAIVLFPFYWLVKREYPVKLCFFIIISVSLVSLFVNWGDYFIAILSHTYYSKYVLMLDVYREIEGNSTGLGFLFINLLGLMVLYKADIILNLHPELQPFIWAYFSFLLLRILLADLPVFLRITIYFDYSMYIVIPYYLNVCYKKWNNIIAVSVVSLLLLVLFSKSVFTDAFNLKYKFIFFENVQ